MKRHLTPVVVLSALFVFLALLPLLASAQVGGPQATEEPFGAPPTPEAGIGQPLLIQPEAQPVQPDDARRILIAARRDLDALARARLGAQRPDGWSGSADLENPQLPILIRLDLELLANALVGVNRRPPAWFGAVRSTPFAIARDIRHDLELLADISAGVSLRPPEWIGDDPLFRCGRETQSLVSLLREGGIAEVVVNPVAPDYCEGLAVQVSVFAESNLLHMPEAVSLLFTADSAEAAIADSGGGAGVGNAQPDGVFTVAFTDRNARFRVGVIPPSARFTPVGRSDNRFSNMMFVTGDGFEVFVDFVYTTLTEDQFRALPPLSSDPPFSCAAAWCTVPFRFR